MEHQIFTWGYGNRPIAALDALLAEHPKGVVIDTRISAKNAWTASYTRTSLEKRLGGFYMYEGHFFGNNARKEPGPVQWMPPVELATVDAELAIIKRSLDSTDSTPIFMCCEMDWRKCHRQFVAARAVEVAWIGFDIVHL